LITVWSMPETRGRVLTDHIEDFLRDRVPAT
jgi:hypothetical protein